MTPEQNDFFTMLPATVRYDSNLSDFAKVLFSEILALSKKNGFCWATNEHFAGLFSKHETTVSRAISELKNQKYIQIESTNSKNGTVRNITPLSENANRALSKNAKTPLSENDKTPLSKNANHNRIKINKEKENRDTPPHKTDLDQFADKKIETSKPYEVDIQNYHFNNWTGTLKEAFFNFCSDQYDKNKKFSGTRAKEIIRQIEIDIAISGAKEAENAVRFCLAAGWNYKFSYYQNSNESKVSQKTEQPQDLEVYLLANYPEKDVRYFKSDGKLETWEKTLSENLFKVTNMAKGYKNENLSPLFFFEIMFLPLSNQLNGSKPERKIESFEKIYSQQNDYNKEKADFRKIIKAVYEKTKA